MNNIKVSLADILPIMAEKLENGGEVSFTVSGTSMQPMVYNRRDTVTIKKAVGRMKKYDVPFYRRDDGQFVLHRVIKVQKNGNYTCRGDNQWVDEPDVRDDQIIGMLSSFTRKGKTYNLSDSFSYKVYCRVWPWLRYHRLFLYYLQRIKAKLTKK